MALSAILLAACSSKEEYNNGTLLKTVSFNASPVIVMNMEQMMAQQADFDTELAGMDCFADLSSVVVVAGIDGRDRDSYTTFMIDNSDSLNIYINDRKLMKSGDVEGFTVYDLNEMSSHESHLMVKDKQAWLTARPEIVTADVAAARKRHFGQDIGIIESIEDAHTINVAVNLGAMKGAVDYDKNLADGWGIANVDFQGETVDGVFKIIDSEGKPIDIPGMQTINPQFLKYVNGTPDVAAAVGLTKDFPWKALRIVLQSMGASDVAMALSIAKNIEGTVALSLSIDPNTDDISGMALIDTSRAEIESIMTMLRHVSSGEITEVSAGVYRVPVSMLSSGYLYAGNVEGQLYIGTYAPGEGNGNNDLASVFTGKEMGLSLNCSPEVMLNLSNGRFPYGLEGNLQVSKSEGAFKFTVKGDGKSILRLVTGR